MASRTSTSVGMGVTVTLMGLLLLATFILAVVFYGQQQRLGKELDDHRTRVADIVRNSEQNDDSVMALLPEARAERQSLVMYLIGTLGTTMDRSIGNKSGNLEDLTSAMDNAGVSTGTSLLGALRQRDAEITSLNRQLDDAKAAREAARNDMLAEVDRLTQVQAGHSQTVASLNSEIDRYRAEAERYRGRVGLTIDTNEQRVEEIRTLAAETETVLRERISEMDERMLVLADQLKQLKAERFDEILRPKDEAALVDARIIGVEGAERKAFLDIGRDQRVVLGMTLEVYADGAAIRKDAAGNYPPGKATLEVIRIDKESSVCRIVRSTRGNPVITGDVAANAVYDPNKSYVFVVFGNFDADRDGVATPAERGPIVGMINDWGGKLEDDLSGRVDFLVLGERPVLPPSPPADAPTTVVLEFIRKQGDAQQYDKLFEIASQTGIPVLNENRLYTLTGFSGR